MNLREERNGDIQILVVADHLDTMTAPAFEERLLGLLDSGERRLLIDCEPLRYVNSAGLKALLLAAKRIETLGGKLVLCSMIPSVLTVFDTIGFNRIMQIEPTREDAMRAFEAALAAQ